MNTTTDESQWRELPYQVGQTIPEVDRSHDPFVRSQQRYDMTFMDEFLTARIEEQMKSNPQFKDMEAGFRTMFAKSRAGSVRMAFLTLSGSVHSSGDTSAANDTKNRYSDEYDIITKAFALRNNGKTDKEILELLNQNPLDWA